MVVSRIHRSLSFTAPSQNSTTSSASSNSSSAPKAYHVRSTSLPTRSHPLISQLGQDLRSLRLWRLDQQATVDDSCNWLISGFGQLEQLLHATLDNLLHLPQTQDSLRRHRTSSWVDSLLDDFLSLVDAYGCFRDMLVSLQQLHSATQSAVRRRDEVKLACHARSRKKAEKEMLKLASSLCDMGRIHEPILYSDSSEAELAGVMREVKVGIASASASVFSGLVTLASDCLSLPIYSSSPSLLTWSYGRLLKKLTTVTSSSRVSEKTEEEWGRCLEGFKTLGRCVEGLEIGSEKVFRCLVKTRVALLNVLTP